jgi:hypothetical protein
MPMWVNIRAAPQKDGEPCPFFNPAVWWRGLNLMGDPRFRVIEPDYFVACLSVKEMRELQERFRPRASGVDHWDRDVERLDKELRKDGRWWVVSIYEWDSGYD